MATASDDENLQLNHAVPAPLDALLTKRQRLQEDDAPRQVIGRVFDVEMLLRGLLTLLDLASLASFLEVLALDETWRDILTHEQLWREMLHTHFAGNLPPAEQFNDDEQEEEDEEEEEEDDEELQEEEEEDEPDLIEVLEGDMMVDNEDFFEQENETSDDDVVFVPPPRPRTGRSARQVAAERAEAQVSAVDGAHEPRQPAAIVWIDGVPSQKVLDVACPDLKEFLQSAEQLVQFDTCVQIIRGDIGEIETVGDQSVDGLAFPTASYMRNPYSGAAAVIFARAGQGLSEHVKTLDVRLEVGQAHATPGFDAGVDKLIHCVGPSGFHAHCLKDLQRTYRSVLICIQRENLSCVAMTSISTGNMGLPVDNAAWFALCAIQRYMRATNWTATIGIVCFEANVYAAFAESKTKVLSQFNADIVRANPPLRHRFEPHGNRVVPVGSA